jgi:hypothetical protein
VHGTHAATFLFENSAQGSSVAHSSSCQLKFVHGFPVPTLSSPVREKEREREGEREKGREGERKMSRIVLFLKVMMGALAPFSYLVI